MSIIVVFMVTLMTIFVWWIVTQRVTAKTWLEQGVAVDPRESGDVGYLPYSTAKLGLWVFMVVITSFFMLFVAAYYMRMMLGDWVTFHPPSSLWFNTGLLMVASIALQGARHGLDRPDGRLLRLGYMAGGLFALAFIGAQLWVWRQLMESGQLVTSSPAVSFFYLLTALHAIHMLGGVVVWLRGALRLLAGAPVAQVRLLVESCSVYWHYLLLLWLGLFALLTHT